MKEGKTNYTGSGRSDAIECGWLGYVNVSHKVNSNLNISPKMSYAVLQCDVVMLQDCMLMIL